MQGKRIDGHGHLPWYRRYVFLLPALLVYAAYVVFLMPRPGTLRGFSILEVTAAALAYVALVVIVQMDREKPTWLKNLLAAGFFVLLGWIFYRYSSARWADIGRYFFNLEVMRQGGFLATESTVSNWQLMLRGLWAAIRIFVLSAVLSSVLALVLAVMRVLVNDVLMNIAIDIYVDIFRAAPTIALLIVFYSSLPYTGIVLSGFATGVLTLTLIEGAYLCEVFRAGIEAIHKNQVEAARSLGLNALKTMRLVVLPQAATIVIPPFTNRMIGLMKRTAECSVIAIFELLNAARQIQSWYANATPLVAAAVFYLLFLVPLTRAVTVMENRLRR